MNFGAMPPHIRKRHVHDIPSLGKLDDAVLPSLVPYEHADTPAGKETREAVLDSSAKLDSLTEKALKFYDDLLSEPPATDDPKVLSAQSDAARTIMTTQLRVDDSRLKKRQTDTLAKLLERMDQEDARLSMKTINA